MCILKVFEAFLLENLFQGKATSQRTKIYVFAGCLFVLLKVHNKEILYPDWRLSNHSYVSRGSQALWVGDHQQHSHRGPKWRKNYETSIMLLWPKPYLFCMGLMKSPACKQRAEFVPGHSNTLFIIFTKTAWFCRCPWWLSLECREQLLWWVALSNILFKYFQVSTELCRALSYMEIRIIFGADALLYNLLSFH